MKAWSIAGILAVAVPLLFTTTGYAWWVSREYTDWDEYQAGGGDGTYYHDSKSSYMPTYYYSFADVWAEIEGEEQYTGAAAFPYVYWTETIMGYDPGWDPPLLAHVGCEAYAMAYALYDLEGSDYDAVAAAHGYASGYRVDPYVQITEPEDGDIATDWFDEDIDIYENGYPIYLREFAYATAQTSTTERKVRARAYADSDTTCVIVQNP